MADVAVSLKKDKKNGEPKDLSGFSIGQNLEGKLLSVKAFGAFVEVPGGANVLLPRSILSRGAYSKLSKMAETKSKDVVKLEIVAVNQQNQTLSGKLFGSTQQIADLESKGAEGYSSMNFNATIVGGIQNFDEFNF